MNRLGRFGLTGNSGFIPNNVGIFHINANYDSNGMVFVKHRFRHEKEYWDGWKRMKKETAIKQKKEIILCSYCRRPAVSLDHSWPWLQEETVCAVHFKKRRA